jgi:hypothetical protein
MATRFSKATRNIPFLKLLYLSNFRKNTLLLEQPPRHAQLSS